MWAGGVRVIVIDEKERLLLVCQHHEGKDIWMLPGGAIEAEENAVEAAKREVLEETGLEVSVGELVWHIEEVSHRRGQRFVNYFTADITGGKCGLGSDPELGENAQVLKDIRFMGRDEVNSVEHLHPAFLKNEIWDIIDRRSNDVPRIHSVYRNRVEYGV